MTVIEFELFLLILNSTYSQQEFPNEITEMKNLEFILNGNVYLNDTDEYANYNDTYRLYIAHIMTPMICPVLKMI